MKFVFAVYQSVGGVYPALIMVRPEYRGRGYSSELLSFAIERLKNLQKELYIITFPDLEPTGTT